jgi:hypothetical protein
MNPGGQGSEFAAFIEEELKQEFNRRDLVNARSTTAITASTGMVTVVLAVIAVLKGKDFTLTGWSLRMLFVGLLALLAAAVLGVLAGLSWGYKVLSGKALKEVSGPRWPTPEQTARSMIAQFNVVTITTLRKGNDIKFWLFFACSCCQAAALLALGATALIAAR